jgi:hypothetical protein
MAMIVASAMLTFVLQGAASRDTPKVEPKGEPRPGVSAGVQYDANGWPMVSEPQRRPEPAPVPAAAAAGRTDAARTETGADGQLSSLFQAVRSQAAFRSLGGVTVTWQLTVFGPRGEAIGTREVIQRADVSQNERDRLECGDRVFGGSGGLVFATRGGMPWPSLQETGAQELRFYGMLLRTPWLFADGATFALMARDQVQRSGEQLVRFKFERRSERRNDLFGPEEQPVPCDSFELLCEPAGMLPRELVWKFASGGQTRRMLLEDWREVAGVRLPHRRILVDADGRQTTQIDIKAIQTAEPLSDRDFRVR